MNRILTSSRNWWRHMTVDHVIYDCPISRRAQKQTQTIIQPIRRKMRSYFRLRKAGATRKVSKATKFSLPQKSFTCFCFPDSLSRGDRAFSVARITALTLAQHAFMTSRAFGMRSLVFAGHFPDVCGVRDVITAELSMKNECVRAQNVSVCVL